MISILVVAQSECEGEDQQGKKLASQRRQTFLFEKINTFAFDNQDESDGEEAGGIPEPENFDHEVQALIGSIERTAKEEADKCQDSQKPNS